MGRWIAFGCSAAVLGMSLIGCERAPAPPPTARAESAPTSMPDEARPTTQELLSGDLHKLVLPGIPLALQVPSGWKVGPTAETLLLEGPTPADRGMVQVSSRDPIPADRVDALIERMQRENDMSGPVSKAAVRVNGKLRVLDRLSTAKPLTTPKLDFRGNPEMDASGNPVTITTTTVHWTSTVFVQEAQMCSRYELNVIDLTLEQFEQNRPFYERILGTISYEPTEAPAAAPAKTQ